LEPTSSGKGIVALVGESDGGKPGMHLFPGGSSPAIVKSELKSGPGADMVRLALRSSSSDPLVRNGASAVLFYKTNPSTYSEVKAGGMVTGAKEVSSITCAADVAKSLKGKYFLIPDAAGLVAVWFNFDSATPPTAGDRRLPVVIAENDTAATVATAVRLALNTDGAWVAAGTNPIVLATDLAFAARTGQSNGTCTTFTVAESVEGIDPDVLPQITIRSKQYGDFTALYTAAIASSSAGKIITIQDENGVPESSPAFESAKYMSILYTGNATTALLTLEYISTVLWLKVTLAGQTDASVSFAMQISSGTTIKQAVQLLSSKTGYTALVVGSNDSFKVMDLDLVLTSDAVSAKTVAHEFTAGIYEAVDWSYTTSGLVDVIRGTLNDGNKLPTTLATSALTGGVRGYSSNSDVQAGLNALLSYRCNIVNALFSEDDQDGSSIDIQSVNSMVKDHMANRSSLLGRSEAQGYVSIKGNKAAFKAECLRMNSNRVAVTSQVISDLNVAGVVTTFPEYAFAVMCAQMQSGTIAIGTPLENRVVPCSSVETDVSWNPVLDSAEMLKAGALFAKPDQNNIFRLSGGYESWLSDTNNANIFIETVESLDIFAFNHRAFMQEAFGGRSKFVASDVLSAIERSQKAEVGAGTIKSYDAKLTKLIKIDAGELRYELAITPWEGVRWILPTVDAIRAGG
jgi:hypothetical protein